MKYKVVSQFVMYEKSHSQVCFGVDIFCDVVRKRRFMRRNDPITSQLDVRHLFDDFGGQEFVFALVFVVTLGVLVVAVQLVPLVPEHDVDDGGKEEDERSDEQISRGIRFQG